MKPYRLFALILALATTLTACGTPGHAAVQYDVAGLYTQVLETLWDTDPALNEGITYVSVDLSNAPGGLTDEEKANIVEAFAAARRVQPLTLSRQELIDQGYFTEEDGGWDDGIILTIKSRTQTQSPTDFVFDAGKWRTIMGSCTYYECTPKWSETGDFIDFQSAATAES